MKRFLAAAIAILATVATIALLAGLALSLDLRGKGPVRGAQARQPPAQDVADVRIVVSEDLVKRFPQEANPSDAATDPASCRKAGGDWLVGYELGERVTREPLKGAKQVGKRCWSRR